MRNINFFTTINTFEDFEALSLDEKEVYLLQMENVVEFDRDILGNISVYKVVDYYNCLKCRERGDSQWAALYAKEFGKMELCYTLEKNKLK